MSIYMSAKEFRLRFPEIVKELEQAREIVVLRRSKPLFRVVPFNGSSADLLDRAGEVRDNSQPDLNDISRIVHKVRRVK